MAERVKGKVLNWNKIKSPQENQVRIRVIFLKCPHLEVDCPIRDIAKMCGGAGEGVPGKVGRIETEWRFGNDNGMCRPQKCHWYPWLLETYCPLICYMVEVRDGLSFLDLSVIQIEQKNAAFGTSIPLVLMNSFNTDDETKKIIKKYEGNGIDILTFNQSRFPRINKDSLQPLPKDTEASKSQWYPPGHGDLFPSLVSSGIVDRLLAEGKEYLFVSNGIAEQCKWFQFITMCSR